MIRLNLFSIIIVFIYIAAGMDLWFCKTGANKTLKYVNYIFSTAVLILQLVFQVLEIIGKLPRGASIVSTLLLALLYVRPFHGRNIIKFAGISLLLYVSANLLLPSCGDLLPSEFGFGWGMSAIIWIPIFVILALLMYLSKEAPGT